MTDQRDETPTTLGSIPESARHLLSDKPLRRPRRQLSSADLRRLAAENPPPAEWFEGDDERPW